MLQIEPLLLTVYLLIIFKYWGWFTPWNKYYQISSLYDIFIYLCCSYTFIFGLWKWAAWMGCPFLLAQFTKSTPTKRQRYSRRFRRSSWLIDFFALFPLEGEIMLQVVFNFFQFNSYGIRWNCQLAISAHWNIIKRIFGNRWKFKIDRHDGRIGETKLWNSYRQI